MTDMVSQFGQFLSNNTDVAIDSIAAVTGIDKNTVTIGTAVLTTLGAVAVGTALTFKYGETCRKKLPRNTNNATPNQTPVLSPALDGGVPEEVTPIDEQNATQQLASSVESGDENSSSSIGERVGRGELARDVKQRQKTYK